MVIVFIPCKGSTKLFHNQGKDGKVYKDIYNKVRANGYKIMGTDHCPHYHDILFIDYFTGTSSMVFFSNSQKGTAVA